MEQKTVVLGPIQVTNITQRKVTFLGGTGSGKTTSLKMLALKSQESKVHTFVFDALNVIYIEGFNRILITKKSKEKGKELGQMLNKLSHNEGVIIAFKDLLQEELAIFCDGLFSTWIPHDDLLCFDEIQEYCPRTGGQPAFEIERKIRTGRNSNIGFVFTSQRAAMVKTNIISLTDYLVILRTTWRNDLDVIEELLGNLNKEETKGILAKIQTEPFLNGFSIDFRYFDNEGKSSQ